MQFACSICKGAVSIVCGQMKCVVAARCANGINQRKINLVLTRCEIGDEICRRHSGCGVAPGYRGGYCWRYGIGERGKDKNIVAGAASHFVCSSATNNDVVAFAAVDGVIAGKAKNLVSAG